MTTPDARPHLHHQSTGYDPKCDECRDMGVAGTTWPQPLVLAIPKPTPDAASIARQVALNALTDTGVLPESAEAVIRTIEAQATPAPEIERLREAMFHRQQDLEWCNKDDDCHTLARGVELAISDFDEALNRAALAVADAPVATHTFAHIDPAARCPDCGVRAADHDPLWADLNRRTISADAPVAEPTE